MSTAAMSERISDLPPPAEDSMPTSQNNIFLTVLRRWPLVLLGLLIGVLGGLGFWAQSPPVYESKAQVLVIKKSPVMIGESARFSYMEDYVSTQATIMKSKKVMRSAADRINNTVRLDMPLPEDPGARTDRLQQGITISRDREPGAAVIGSNVLNVSFRYGDPSDVRVILDNIIAAYQGELKAVYDQDTENEITTIMNYLQSNDKKRQQYNSELAQIRKDLIALIGDDQEPRNIQDQSARRQLFVMDDEKTLSIVNRALKRIAAAGSDPVLRKQTYQQLTNSDFRAIGLPSVNPDDLNSIPNVKTAYELQLKQLRNKYGEQHQLVLDLKAKIEFLEAKLKEQGISGASSSIDNLAQLESILKSQQQDFLEIISKNKALINADQRLIIQASELLIKRSGTEGLLKQLTIDEQLQRDRLSRLEATRNQGGFAATAISEPSDGAKVAPSLRNMLILGLFLGMLGGVLLAFAFELTDKSFRSPAEIRRRLGLPVVGHIPPIRTDLPIDNPALKGKEVNMEPVIVSHLRPKSIEAEAYRGVRTQLYFSTQGTGHQVIQVTSPNPGDGKSTLAANLAVSIAQSGKRVVLIDCDFRKPRVHKIFHLEKPDVGLASVISGDCDLGEAIRTSEVPNMDLLPCGPRPQNPAELLTSPEFQGVLDQLRAKYDFVIIDTPPVLAVSDPAVVAPRVDGVLLVFRMTKKARPTAERAREQLAALGANVIGVIVNGTGRQQDDGYGYGYNYGYGYQYQYQYEYEYADNYSDDGLESPSSYGELPRPPLPPAKD